MNKFNKKLTISVPEDPLYTQSNESQSPPPQDHDHEVVHNEKESLLQFREYRDGGDSEFGQNRQENHHPKLHFVEFEEFNAYSHSEKQKKDDEVRRKGFGNKRNVVIELPDRDEDRNIKMDKNSNGYDQGQEDDKFKEPPAPSKGSKLSKVFVFPATPLKKEDKVVNKSQAESVQQLKKSFERQRQQFYKQKSKLEKQILIKNGQIDMLHKLLTENLANPQQRATVQQPKYTSNAEQIEAILLQKDLHINELLQKISELDNVISRKNEEMGRKILDLNNSQSMVESLKNQLYIYERKDESEKLTKKYYQLQADKSRDDNNDDLRLSKEFGTKGLESLYKRIQMVRMSRLEFDSRNKMKSEVSYSQTAKNRTKGAFDFKGKTFEHNPNSTKTRMY